jgi:hypothetical protein
MGAEVAAGGVGESDGGGVGRVGGCVCALAPTAMRAAAIAATVRVMWAP